jgi:hypothetical protein
LLNGLPKVIEGIYMRDLKDHEIGSVGAGLPSTIKGTLIGAAVGIFIVSPIRYLIGVEEYKIATGIFTIIGSFFGLLDDIIPALSVLDLRTPN